MDTDSAAAKITTAGTNIAIPQETLPIMWSQFSTKNVTENLQAIKMLTAMLAARFVVGYFFQWFSTRASYQSTELKFIGNFPDCLNFV